MKFKYYRKFIFSLIFSRKKFVSEFKESVFEIDFESYKNLRLIIFDFDDTLSSHLGQLNEDSIKLLKKLKENNFEVAVYSNCGPNRNKYLIESLTPLKVFNVNRSTKPDPQGYIEVMNHFGTKPEQTMMVGDRIGTDIYGAFLANIEYRILVKPYSIKFGGAKATGYHYIMKSLEGFLYKLTRGID